MVEEDATPTCPNLEVTNEWQEGMNADLVFTVDHETSSWIILLGFDKPFNSLDIYVGSASSSDNQNWEIHNLDWDGEQHVGDQFTLQMLAHFSAGGKGTHCNIAHGKKATCRTYL